MITYDFSLDKKQIVLLVIASLLLAVLLFIAGMLCGMLYRQSSATQLYHQGTPHQNNQGTAPPERGNRGITLNPSPLSTFTPSALMSKAKSEVGTEKADMMASTRQPIRIGGESQSVQPQRTDTGESGEEAGGSLGQTDDAENVAAPQLSEQSAPENQQTASQAPQSPASQSSESGNRGITLNPASLSTFTPSALVSKAKSAVATEKADLMATTRQPIRIGGKSQSGQTGGEVRQSAGALKTDTGSDSGNALARDAEKREDALREKPKPKMRYFVEVDSFVLETKAFNKIDDLIDKGWDNASVLKMGNLRDKKGTSLYIVQIGDYDHLKEAHQAASDFEEKEGIIGKVNPMKPGELKKRKMSGPSGEDESK